MKIVFASDSFKGTLSSAQIARLLDRAAREVFGAACETRSIVVADGGEGLLDALLSAREGELASVDAHDPLMRPLRASWARFADGSAVVESARTSGLGLLKESERNPLETTTYGTGETVAAALASGARRIAVGLGGTCTNDGGMGFACALGVRFYDADGRLLEGKGSNLEKVSRIDASQILPAARAARFEGMSDVRNPLCGSEGATRVFGRQKGGTPDVLDRLERGMTNYRDAIRREFGVDPDAVSGAGAAGGLGAALSVFFGAELRSGVDVALDFAGFDAAVSDADLVVTGEGRADGQTRFGKTMAGVAERSRRSGARVVALCGSLGEGWESVFELGIDSVATTVDAPMTLSEACARAEELYYSGAIRLFRSIRAGLEIGASRVRR